MVLFGNLDPVACVCLTVAAFGPVINNDSIDDCQHENGNDRADRRKGRLSYLYCTCFIRDNMPDDGQASYYFS